MGLELEHSTNWIIEVTMFHIRPSIGEQDHRWWILCAVRQTVLSYSERSVSPKGKPGTSVADNRELSETMRPFVASPVWTPERRCRKKIVRDEFRILMQDCGVQMVSGTFCEEKMTRISFPESVGKLEQSSWRTSFSKLSDLASPCKMSTSIGNRNRMLDGYSVPEYCTCFAWSRKCTARSKRT